MTELEHIKELEDRLQELFETVAASRDEAQKALSGIIEIKSDLTKYQIELLRKQSKEQ